MLGESVTIRKINGRVVIKNRPRHKIVADPSDKQILERLKFKEAHLWATEQMKKPDVKALYKSKITDKMTSAFNVAMTDYLTSPQVQGIDTNKYKGAVGDAIVTKGVDDFIISRIDVVINDATGKVLEQGSATQDQDRIFLWAYAATAPNPVLAGTTISVTAYDRAGNQTLLEKVL